MFALVSARVNWKNSTIVNYKIFECSRMILTVFGVFELAITTPRFSIRPLPLI